MVNSKSLLKLDKVSFGYKPNDFIIKDVSLAIAKNEHIAIVGANASGKSTLAKVITGLCKPNSGKIYYDGKLIDTNNFQILKDNVGVIFENPQTQIIGDTVEQDIAFGLENKQLKKTEMINIISNVSKITGIESLLNQNPNQLSGGQQQKLAIASVLAVDPQIIIFDESTSMLDGLAKQSIYELITRLIHQYHKTVITITHDMDEAIKADKMLILSNGKVVVFDKPQNVVKHNLKKYGLNNPFAYELSSKLKGIDPTIDVNQLIKEIKDAK